jgi:hypothetical protein
MSDFSDISALPAVDSPPPKYTASGMVLLYRDGNWQSEEYAINIADYREGVRQSITGTSMNDAASWIAFNLPVGTVMTLTEHAADTDGYPVWNLRNCGRVVDLIGTGKMETVDLSKCNMNDCISSFFWRKMSFQNGALELFEAAQYGGNRTVIFLDDWPYCTVNSLQGWYISDLASSARWASLDSTIEMSLFNNYDGTGSSYNNIMGWSGGKQIDAFSDVGFNDGMSSFRWQGLQPVQESVNNLILNDFSVPPDKSLAESTSVTGRNNSSEPMPVTSGMSISNTQTVTVTVTNTYTLNTTVNGSVGFTAGVPLVEKANFTLTVALGFTWAQSDQSSKSFSQAVTLNISESPTVPPNCSYSGTVTVQVGKLDSTQTYTTTATRWYDQPVSGSQLDNSNGPTNGLYWRVETVTFTLSGALACGVDFDIEATPLTG